MPALLFNPKYICYLLNIVVIVDSFVLENNLCSQNYFWELKDSNMKSGRKFLASVFSPFCIFESLWLFS